MSFIFLKFRRLFLIFQMVLLISIFCFWLSEKFPDFLDYLSDSFYSFFIQLYYVSSFPDIFCGFSFSKINLNALTKYFEYEVETAVYLKPQVLHTGIGIGQVQLQVLESQPELLLKQTKKAETRIRIKSQFWERRKTKIELELVLENFRNWIHGFLQEYRTANTGTHQCTFHQKQKNPLYRKASMGTHLQEVQGKKKENTRHART